MDFTENCEFEVTLKMFRERTEPDILVDAGNHVVRAFREASAEHLEDLGDVDAPLTWVVTQHPFFGVFTVHYVAFNSETNCFEGKFFYGAQGWLPSALDAWIPVSQVGGNLERYDGRIPTFDEDTGVMIGEWADDFAEYTFSGWIPISSTRKWPTERNTYDPVEWITGMGVPYAEAKEVCNNEVALWTWLLDQYTKTDGSTFSIPAPTPKVYKEGVQIIVQFEFVNLEADDDDEILYTLYHRSGPGSLCGGFVSQPVKDHPAPIVMDVTTFQRKIELGQL